MVSRQEFKWFRVPLPLYSPCIAVDGPRDFGARLDQFRLFRRRRISIPRFDDRRQDQGNLMTRQALARELIQALPVFGLRECA